MHSDTCAVIVTQLYPPTGAAVTMSVIIQISNLSNWNAVFKFSTLLAHKPDWSVWNSLCVPGRDILQTRKWHQNRETSLRQSVATEAVGVWYYIQKRTRVFIVVLQNLDTNLEGCSQGKVTSKALFLNVHFTYERSKDDSCLLQYRSSCKPQIEG